MCVILIRCKRVNDRVSEAKYPVISNEGGTPVVLGKIKRVKSMQPKPLEEEVAKSVGACEVHVWGCLHMLCHHH